MQDVHGVQASKEVEKREEVPAKIQREEVPAKNKQLLDAAQVVDRREMEMITRPAKIKSQVQDTQKVPAEYSHMERVLEIEKVSLPHQSQTKTNAW